MKTRTGKTFGEEISTYTAKLIDGYVLDHATAPITIGTDSTKNVISVYYAKRTDLSYSVKYYYDNVLDETKTDNFSGKTFGEEISTYTAKLIDGYVLDHATAPITIGTDSTKNVISVYYAKRTDLSYSVKYYYDNVLDETKTDNFSGKTFGEEISTYTAKLIDGYVLDHATAPITIGTDSTKNVISVYYAKRTDLSYSVKYYYDNVLDETKTDPTPTPTPTPVIDANGPDRPERHRPHRVHHRPSGLRASGSPDHPR
jgi:hypothetical protein